MVRWPVCLAGALLTSAFGFPLVLNTAMPLLIVLGYVIRLAVIHDVMAGTQGAWLSELFSVWWCCRFRSTKFRRLHRLPNSIEATSI
jgi:hypothetical protein